MSLKVGPILLLPGYLFILVAREGPLKALLVVAFVIGSNMAMAYPFLATNSYSYVN